MTDVYLETGKNRVFACALDWPGWSGQAGTGGRAERQPPVAGEELPCRIGFRP